MKLKKGDQVNILSGKDKGKGGKIIHVFIQDEKAVVEGVNLLIRHKRSKKEGQKGEKVRVPMPVHMSNMMIVCQSCKKPTRLGYKFGEKGSKVRVCKKCGSET